MKTSRVIILTPKERGRGWDELEVELVRGDSERWHFRGGPLGLCEFSLPSYQLEPVPESMAQRKHGPVEMVLLNTPMVMVPVLTLEEIGKYGMAGALERHRASSMESEAHT